MPGSGSLEAPRGRSGWSGLRDGWWVVRKGIGNYLFVKEEDRLHRSDALRRMVTKPHPLVKLY